MLGHVSASLAHEIKNPLASIKGAAEILADEVPKGHEKHEFIEIMRSEISRLNNSVEDVLKYCRGQQEKGELKLTPVHQIIDRVTALLETRVKEKSIGLRVNHGKGSSGFKADEGPLIQVLMNIMLNSIEAVDKKGQIQVDHFPQDGGYLIEVSDNGPGIDKSIESQIFESFVTSKAEGTGLGLSISRKIVDSMGGNIRTGKSQSGGARFRVYLPEIESETDKLKKI